MKNILIYWDTNFKREYYYDPLTKDTTWEAPEGKEINFIDKSNRKERER